MAASLTAPDAATDAAWTQLLDRFACHLDAQRAYLERVGGEEEVAPPGTFEPGVDLPAPSPAIRERLDGLRAENDELVLLSRALLTTVVAATTGAPTHRAETAPASGGRLVDRAL